MAGAKPYTEVAVTVPPEVTKSLETSTKPVLVNIEGENGMPALEEKAKTKAPMVETIVVKLPSIIKAEEESTVVPVKGPGKKHVKASMQHGTAFIEIPEGEDSNENVNQRKLENY